MNCARVPQAAELEQSAAARVTCAILDLLGAAYAELPCTQSQRSSLASAHRIRIINYIELHLHAPDLTPTTPNFAIP